MRHQARLLIKLVLRMAWIPAVCLNAGCFDPARVVAFKLYPSPIFGHVDLDQDLTGAESFTLDAAEVRRVLPHARWRLAPAGCKGCWLATMKLDNGREFRIRLDRFRFWFEVQGCPGCYVFPDGPQKEAFVALTRPGSDWIHSNEYRWTIAGAAQEEDR